MLRPWVTPAKKRVLAAWGRPSVNFMMRNWQHTSSSSNQDNTFQQEDRGPGSEQQKFKREGAGDKAAGCSRQDSLSPADPFFDTLADNVTALHPPEIAPLFDHSIHTKDLLNESDEKVREVLQEAHHRIHLVAEEAQNSVQAMLEEASVTPSGKAKDSNPTSGSGPKDQTAEEPRDAPKDMNINEAVKRMDEEGFSRAARLAEAKAGAQEEAQAGQAASTSTTAPYDYGRTAQQWEEALHTRQGDKASITIQSARLESQTIQADVQGQGPGRVEHFLNCARSVKAERQDAESSATAFMEDSVSFSEQPTSPLDTSFMPTYQQVLQSDQDNASLLKEKIAEVKQREEEDAMRERTAIRESSTHPTQRRPFHTSARVMQHPIFLPRFSLKDMLKKYKLSSDQRVSSGAVESSPGFWAGVAGGLLGCSMLLYWATRDTPAALAAPQQQPQPVPEPRREPGQTQH